MRWTRDVARVADWRGAFKGLVGTPAGKSPLRRPRHRLEDNIKTCLQEVGWVAWTGFVWLRIIFSYYVYNNFFKLCVEMGVLYSN